MNRRIAAAVLVAIGCAQMAADLLGLETVKAVAAATSASPAMKVFTSVRGFETFASRFYLQWRTAEGEPVVLELTPERYRGLRGPYNRRNAYGATLSYAPVLTADARTRALFESVVDYAFCGEGQLLIELGIDPASVSGPITVRLEPRRPVGAEWQLVYEVHCNA
jgi:hypothetical protein